MADRKFTITFDVNGNVAPIKQALSKFQSDIKNSNIKVPISIQSGIEKTISKLNDEIQNFESLTSKGFSNLADFNKAEKSFDKIGTLMKQLSSYGGQIKGLDAKKFIPKETIDRIEKLKSALKKTGEEAIEKKTTNKKLEAQTREIEQQKEALRELQTEYDALAAKNKQLGSSKGALSGQIKSEEAKVKQLVAQMEALEKTKGGKNSSQYGALKAEFSAISKILKTHKTEYANLDAAINKNKATMSGLMSQIGSSVTHIQQLEQAFEQLKLASENNENLKELRENLASLKNVSIDEVPEDLEEIQKVIEDLEADEIKKLAEALNKLGAGIKVDDNLHAIAEGLEATGNSVHEASRSAQELERFKNQLLDFFSISNAVQIFKNAIRNAFDTVKELDAAMTETAVVTNFSIGDMWDKLPQYSEQANKLGSSIKSLYEATTLYYQQGLNSDQAMSVGVETMKMARVANMDAAAATEAMTAALRGFNMEINEMSATRINDVYSELAAITAADTSQIATAMSKTASIADSANMEFETTAALLAQIIETTQEAPETAGTAMKTIIARFTEVKQLFSEGMLTGKDMEGEEININKIDAALKTVGISLKDFLNGTKGIDDIFLELASKWDTLDIATQRYIATTAAGSRQQSRFLAMMSNYDRTMELVSAANNSAGASQEQFNKTLDSLDAKIQRLKNAWAEFTMGLANNDLIKGAIDVLSAILETINKLTGAMGNDGLGGVVTMITRLATVIMALKGGKIALDGILGMTSIGKDAEVARSAFQKIITDMGLLSKEGEKTAGILSLITKLGTKTTGILGKIGAAKGGITALIAGFGKIAIVVGAVIVVFTLLKKAYESWYSSTAEGKLEAAQEATQQAGEAAERAKEEYNELKTALDSIQGKQSTLENMARGTDEWRNAVRELNNEVLTLIQNYPELGQFVYSSGGGVLKIDYDKVVQRNGKEITADSVIQDYENKTFTSQTAKQLSEVAKNTAQSEVDLENVAEKFQAIYTEDSQKEIFEAVADAIVSGKIIPGENPMADVNNWLQQSGYEGAYIVAPDKDQQKGFSTLASYGQKRAEDKQQREAYLDSAVASAMAMANLQSETSDSVMGLDRDLLRAQMEQSVEQGKALYSTLTDFDKQKFADSMGYTYKNGAFYDSEDKKVKKGVSDSDIQNYLGALKGSEIMTSSLELISQNLSNMGEVGETLGSLLSDEGSGISAELVRGFAERGPESINEFLKDASFQLGGDGGEVAQNEIAKQLGFSDRNGLVNIIKENLLIANERQMKERVKLGKELKKYDKAFDVYGEEGLENHAIANFLKWQEDNRGTEFTESFASLIDSISDSGDEGIVEQAITKFREMSSAMDGDKLVYSTEELQAVSDLVSEINWNNPIQAAARLNEEIQNGTPATKEYAESLLQVGNSMLGAGSQMRYFLESTDYSDIKEDIEETIDAQGELSGMDVYQLAESCESLQTMMENTGITAEGLAQTLTMISDGSIGMYQLTDAVMAAMSGFESLDSIIYSALNGIEKFDAGMNENDIADFIGTAHETISGNIQKGAWGNSQNDRYLDFLLGPNWDKVGDTTLSGKEYEQRMKYASDQLGKNKANMGASWRQLAEGKNFWGEQTGTKLSDGFTYLGESPVEGTGLRVKKNYDGSVRLEGFEGMTTDQLVSELAKAYGITEQYAEMMLGDFANYSSDIRQSLDLNDFTKGIEQAYEKTRSVNFSSSGLQSSYKIIDESEIEAIAKAYGKTAKEVREEFEQKGSLVSQFYGKDGQIKDTEGIISELNRLASETSGIENLDFAEGFTSSTWNSEDGWKKTIDYDGMMNALEQLNLPDSVKSDIANSFVQSASEGAEGAATVIETTLSNGEKVQLEIEPGQSIEQAIARAEKQIENSDLADAIKTVFESIDLQLTFSDESTTQAQAQLTALQETANNTPVEVAVTANTEQSAEQINAFKAEVEAEPVSITVNTVSGTTDNPENTTTTNTIVPTVDSNAAAQITSDINGAISAANDTVNIKANTSSITSAINAAIPSTKTISVNVKLNQTKIEVSGAASATISLRAYKKGLDKAGFTHDALVSENGPELIQTKDGAYLSGLNGPEIVTINKGDRVYTADETKKILSSKNHDVIPRFATGYGPGSGGGSGGTGVTTGTGKKTSSKENEWENPYDMLYNLINYIDRTIRERERIERRYERLLEQIGTTAEEIYNVSMEQLEKLNEEKVAQEELKQKRQQQIVDEFEYHTPEWLKKWFIPLSGEGNDQSDFYRFDENGELIFEIDWDKINAEKSTGMGEAIEEFISKLEEWQDSIEEANDSLEDIQDQIEEIKQRGKEEYADIEERIHDALVSSYQSQIDKLSEINNSINDTNSDLLNAIQNSISKMRQDRENEKTEQNLAEQQRRLAYLKQNSAGNELEIKKLEEQLEQQQENYTDSLVDQKIAELQQQNDEAAEQRERQIEIAQAQLDQYVETGSIWQEIHRLMTEGLLYTEGLDLDSLLADILKNSEEFDGMSEMQQVEWLKELNETIAAALAYIKMNFSGYDMDRVYDSHQTGSTPLPYGIMSQYATGGLADFTGPAWLDGTKSKPELVLNAQDTKNFIQLKDILGSIMTGKTNSTAQNSGDSIYDIDINIENISNDYDVERMAKKIETLINENARYRNNNAISLKR